MANNGIYYSSGNTLNFTTNNTTWATLTSGGTFVMNTVSGGTYLNLPSTTFTGGTVTGATNFTGGLTANTISATTYYNLPYSGTVNGGGTTNYVSKWTGSTGLGDSQIYDNGTFVGIGATAQTYSEILKVSGNGGIVSNSYTFVGHTKNSLAIADGNYINWQSGGNEIAIGSGQPLINSTGTYNIAIGYDALNKNTSGFDNVAIGNTSLDDNTSGVENVGIGHGTLSSNQAGQGNVSLGYHAGSGITSGSYNVFLGYKAGGNETTGNNRLFIANTYEKTLIYGEFDNNKVGINTTTPIADLDVSGNTRIEGSLTANTISATTYYNLPYSGTVNGGGTTNFVSKWTGSTELGDSQIYDDGTQVYIGSQILNSLFSVAGTIGVNEFQIQATANSLAITSADFSSWGTGGGEIAIGSGGPLYASIGAGNVAIGQDSSKYNTEGDDNVAIGKRSLYSNDTGDGNVAVGYNAGSDITSGNYNVFIGYEAGLGSGDNSDRLYVGNTSGKTLIYGEFDNNKVGINTALPIAALDVSGDTRIAGALTANTISATTYYNLPSATFTGGTVTGPTIFTSGLTANTLNVTGNTSLANTTGTTFYTNYIDFNTGTTNPSQTGGRVFFDNTSKALSYYDIANNLVPIAMGQQLYTRVWNATGIQIDKGKVIAITGTSNNLPSAILARNVHLITSARPIGLAAENIPNGSEGLVLNNGILSGITLNTFLNGDTLYLSDTVPGGYVSSTSSLAFTARTNEIGYVLQTGTTTGKIYVNINNEDSNLSLTDIERNILEGNVISSGVYQYTGMTQGTGQTINVALAKGWVVKNTYEYATLPDVTNVIYSGGTNIPLTYLNSADATYILLTSGATILQQTTFPTTQQRRENILLGKVVHPNRSTITSINQTVDFDVSPMAALRDLWTPLKLINQGVIVSYYSAGTMSIQTSAGTLWGNGIGWTTNQLNPDSISISGTSPTTFQYRSRLGPITGSTGLPAAPTGNTTTIDSHHYDLNGSIVAVGGNNRATNQRIYLFPTGLIRIQYGQFSYSSMANAIAGIDTEIFVEYSNNRDNGILIGILTVREDATDLSLTTDAQFRFVSKFGELLAGAGGISTTTLQQAYDNSSNPEIVINSTLDGLSIKNGTGNADNVTNLLEGINSGGTTTSFIRADGAFSGTSIFGAGLTATTISATTYQNLPTDIRTTGATYSNNTFTFTNNTGGTYSVLFNTATGLTVNGNLSITGTTTSGTISATTYQNLPSFNFVKITGTTQFSAGTNNYLNFSGINMTITSGSNNTLIFSAGTGSGGGVTSLTASDGISGNTTTGSVSIVNTDKGSSQNIFKNIKIAGTTQFSAGSNSSDLNFSGVNITITSASTNTLVFSASTGGGISGLGTTNYIPKWTGSTGLGNSQLQDDGSQVFISDVGVVYSAKVSIVTSAYTTGVYSRATQYGIYGGLSGLTAGAAAVYGDATKGQYGVFGNNTGNVAGTYIGVFGSGAQADSGFSGTTYIGGKFYGDPGTGAGYSVWLQDGSEGLNKVLVSATSDGKANWSNTLTGLTNVRSTTISAATYQGNVVTQITAGSNITISPTGGTGNVTINSTGGGSGLGTVYTTSNNFNFL